MPSRAAKSPKLLILDAYIAFLGYSEHELVLEFYLSEKPNIPDPLWVEEV